MAVTATIGFSIPASAQALPIGSARISRRRRIDPQAGHALEKLAHAIEYLTDELIHEGHSVSARSDRVVAVQLLMALNRQVYYECPVVPSFGERLRSILHLRAA